MIKGIIIFFVGLFLLAIVMNGAANWVESKPSPPEKKFEVVDTYKGCDVVRWNAHNLAEYKYFLYCKK